MHGTDSGEPLVFNLKENTIWHKKDVFTIISMISQCRVYLQCACIYRIYIMYMVHMDLWYLILQNFLINQHCFICKSFNCFPFILLHIIKKNQMPEFFLT